MSFSSFRPSILTMVVVSVIAPSLHAQSTSLDIFNRYAALSGVMEKGKKNFFGGHQPEARKYFVQCLDKIPDHHEAHYYLSQMDYAEKDPAKALAHIETAERSLTKLDASYKAVLEEQKATDERDIRMIEDKLMDFGFEGLANTGCMASTIQENTRALDDLKMKNSLLFERKISYDIPASYSFMHGNYLFALHRMEEASAQFLLAIQKDPTHARAWNNLINLYYVDKKFGLALEYLNKADAAKVFVHDGLRKAVLAAAAK